MRSDHVPYSETLLAHQEPTQAISAWQQFNDITDDEAIRNEMDIYWSEHPEMRWYEVVKLFKSCVEFCDL